MDTNSYIGVFDSGLGGLTAVSEILNIMQNERVIYFGDTGRVPYGTRSNETITKYVLSDINFLAKKDVKVIISACGTGSSVVLPNIPGEIDGVRIFGVIEPAAIKAAHTTKNKKIGVLGTTATINSGAYEKCIRSVGEGFEVINAACPLFVPIVENGHTDDEVARLIAKEYLAPLKEAGVDTVILGCTHYGLLSNTIIKILGEINLISSGKEAVIAVKDYLQRKGLANNENSSKEHEFYVSDQPENFKKLGSMLLGRDDFEVTKIEI